MADGTGPAAARYHGRGGRACRTVSACLLVLLAGCVRGPLSALDPAGPAAESVARLWWVMAAGAGLILILMVALGAWAFRRGRSRCGEALGRHLILGGGLVFPLTVLGLLLAYGLPAGRASLPSAGEQAFRVNVTAHQWWWEVSYPDVAGGARRFADEIHIPAGVPVHVRIASNDVIHSFWAPRLGGKLDAVPGRVNVARLLADRPGVYEGACAEFCGVDHARMRLRVIAHEPEELQRQLRAMAEQRVAGAPVGGQRTANWQPGGAHGQVPAGAAAARPEGG